MVFIKPDPAVVKAPARVLIPSAWVQQIFSADQANAGGVVRRARRDVDQYASLEVVMEEARVRGFHVLETGDQVVILCHQGDVIIHC